MMGGVSWDPKKKTVLVFNPLWVPRKLVTNNVYVLVKETSGLTLVVTLCVLYLMSINVVLKPGCLIRAHRVLSIY